MKINDLKAELSIKLLELGKALEAGLPYSELKKIYSEVKELQFQLTFYSIKEKEVVDPDSSDLVTE